MTTPAQRLAQFALFCVCGTTEHPYLNPDDDHDLAQSRCADDIDAVFNAAHSLSWMAKEYAEASGRGSPEMIEYESAMKILEQ